MTGARTSPVLATIGVAATAALVASGVASPAGRPAGTDCGAPFSEGARQPGMTLLVAAPLPDTIPAGLSDAGQPAFGQVADVRRVGGASGDRVEAALRDDRHVVLVPWGFDDDCRPMRWTGSWSWSPPGSEGFYRGELRRSEDWLGGFPTFDVYFAVWEGFPNSPWEHPLGSGQRRLDAEDLFDLYQRLPTPDEMAQRPYGSVSDLVTWRRESGDAADDYPAWGILAAAFERAENERIRTAELPYAGSYRMRVIREGQTVATFFLRTGATGDSPWEMPATSTDHAPSAPMPAESFAAPVYLASSLKALASPDPGTGTGTDPYRDRSCHRSGGLHVRTQERIDVEGARRIWSAEVPVMLIAMCLGEDEILEQLRGPPGGPAIGDASAAFAGEFRHEEDGRYTFIQRASLDGGTLAWLRGERIDAIASR